MQFIRMQFGDIKYIMLVYRPVAIELFRKQITLLNAH